ncbi:MAG: hypothetical protein ACJ8AI_03160 [Rhodopila sp.]
MAEGMPVNTVLRCRYSANGLQRSSDRAQDRRHAQQPQDTASDIELPDPEEVLETFRQVAEAQRAVAQAQAQLAGASEDTPAVPPPAEPRTTSEPARKEPAPKEPATPAEPRPLTDMQWNTLYAGAMATVAAEFSQEMHHLSPAEQKKHRMRIAALTSVSQDLNRGSQPVAWTLPGAVPAGQTAAHYHRPPLR